MNGDPPSDLGATTEAEIREAGFEAYGVHPDASGRPIEILREKVLEVVKLRLANSATAASEKTQNGFAIFLLTDDLRHDRTRLKADRAPNIDTGSAQLAGYVWIVPPLLNSSGRIAVRATELGAAFDELEARDLGSHAAIVVDFVNTELRIYEAGVEKDEDVIRVSIAQEEWPETATGSLLRLFADEFLVTPKLQPAAIQIWNDSANYVPVRAAEKQIQELLVLFLRARLAETHKIEHEYPYMRSGRPDIVINRKLDNGVWVKLAVLELKVARSVSSRNRATRPSALVRHMKKGYLQTRHYKDELQARQAWLVLYDMRRAGERYADLLAVHSAEAASDGIELHCDPLFGSADDYRNSTTP